MPARAALLSLVLASPGLAAPPASPLSPASDTTSILAAIDAADPSLSTNPAPVEQVVAAAELAEARLAAAVDPDAQAELLMLASGARRIAYARTPGPAGAVHLCALLRNVEQVLKQENVPPGLAESAAGYRDDALADLKGATCPSTPPSEPSKPEDAGSKPAEAAEPKAQGPAPLPVSDVPQRRPVAHLAVGGTLAGVAAVLVGGMVGSLVGRQHAAKEVEAINAAYMAEDRPPTDLELMDGIAANSRYERLGSAALGLGLAGGVSLVAGLAVLLAPSRAASRARLRAARAGLVYSF